MIVDEKLKAWATPRQAEMIDALNAHKTAPAAAAALGIKSHANINDAIRAVKAKAALAGYAPEHDFNKIVPEGFKLKRHSQYYDAEGAPRGKWVIASADEEARAKMIDAAFTEAARNLPRLAPIAAPATSRHDLCNLATFSDYHLGMLARRAESGADWNVEIAERMLVAAFEDMISRAPPAGRLILNIQGDFLHTDGLKPVTPTHGHLLDADGSYSYMVRAAIRVLRRLVDIGLMTHGFVDVVFLPGNHDLAGQVWLRHMFSALYENERRLRVIDNETPYFVIEHGVNMLGFHHGHMKKSESLPLLFAARFAEIWGRTRYRFIHVGHRHHEEIKEFSGVRVVQHATLAAPDKHASDGGWDSDRQATLITYHSRLGKVGEVVVTPEMLDIAA